MSRKKSKNKSGKSSAKRTPQRTPGKSPLPQPWPVSAPTATTATHKFSLVDEARWMSNHRTAAFKADKKLRHMPIQFISAGHLVGTIDQGLSPSPTHDSMPPYSPFAPFSPTSTHDNVDSMARMVIHSPSPISSDASSSTDEVVFRGRGQTLHDPSPSDQITPLSPAPILTDVPNSVSVVEIEAQASGDVSIRINRSSSPNNVESDAESVVQDHFTKRRGGRPMWEGATTPWQYRSKPKIGWMPSHTGPDMNGHTDDRDAAMDDYMQNVEDFGLTSDMIDAGFSRREMSLDAGSHNDWESASESQLEDNELNTGRNNGWDSDMLQDFEHLSTSSDIQDTVVQILSKRIRKSGLQYLCAHQGSVTDDARWLPANSLKLRSEKNLIRMFENVAESRAIALESSSESVGIGQEKEGMENTEDAGEDLDDETIARKLQRQEEPGLDSEEVLLYRGDNVFDGTNTKHGLFIDFSRPGKNRQARKYDGRAKTFPSASAMADALAMDPYEGFEIMETERPSLKTKKNGRRGRMPPKLEDPDLNEQLQNAWEADRAKKRLKKAERKMLRQQGLLGRKGRPADLKVKYKDSIVMEDVVEEIRQLMMGTTQSLSLPPMDAHRRATVHRIAAFFGLSSRSRGDGQDRFTILSKTAHTRIMDDGDFDQAIISKGFHKRMRGPLQCQKGGAMYRPGNHTRPQVGYQDGDTVGANAPELGPENKGHALMMKMGWSKGMALGTKQNQGILHPIAHTVKINKAGLQ